MLFKILNTGMLGSNCYIIGDMGEGIIIDPGATEEEIMKAVSETKLSIKYIFLTHAHIDHIISVDKIREKTGAKVLIHKADAKILSDSTLNCSGLLGMNISFKSADQLLDDGDIFNFGGCEIETIHTPGHTPGGICLKTENIIFTGDTLFNMSIGRTDLGKGSYEDLITSINSKLMSLDDRIIVYPGHGAETTIGFEKKNNPFIKKY